ncbi:MAG: diaminohydroxyphosphoribosylaminopyrimidine deaminase [Arcobacteraceae bacterium]|jgi:diaminohydroxyphosphoribosylaminopyrimidine deaminase/5-amino-6-(5-phosphoribosylamino)uracil reductase
MINKFMQLAISEAWKYQFLTYPNPAVGATVVKNNQVLSVEAHKEAGLPHAEVLALKMAYLSKYPTSSLKVLESSHEIHEFLILNHNNFFIDCEIYVTLEPCNHIGKTPACAMLLESIKIKKVYIGTMDPNENASGGKQRLLDAQIEVEINVCKKLTNQLLLPFIKYQNNNCTLFKIAMREDGSVDGGYITTQDSLNLVHEIRAKIDLMVIGGNTVRTDRPTLDSRFSKTKKAANIHIYSNSNNFDKTIPLFHVKNRNVNISSSLKCLDENNFTMIEGGHNLLNTMKNKIDYLMLFISHKEKKTNHYKIDKEAFQIEYSYYLNEFDEVIFLKKIDDK